MYKLDLVGVQAVRWDRGGFEPTGEYTIFYWKGNENHKLRTASLNIVGNIFLGVFNAKVGREDIFKPTIGNENLHEISNDNGVRVVNFATSKNLTMKSTMFPHRSIHKFIYTSPDGKTYNQIDHILIDRRRHSNVLDIRSFRGADCDTDHYLMVEKVRERLAVTKQRTHRFHMERFNLKKMNEVEDKEV
jgi:hypothetical protein